MKTIRICNRKAASNTGLVGISETITQGRARFLVHWRSAPYERRATTVYFGPKSRLTREEALARAKQIRAEGVRERRESGQ